MNNQNINNVETAIAVIGMATRFPGAPNVDSYWKMLVNGETGLIKIPDSKLEASGVSRQLFGRSDYVPFAGVLEEVANFDAAFFSVSPREAEILDVQQRFLLEIGWEALQDGGYDPKRYDGRIGVFAGSSMSSYLFGVLAKPDLTNALGELAIRHANDKDFVATQLSYKLDLRGPAVAVQTSCSTGLVAVHLAIQSLLSGESDMTLAGAVSIRVPQETGYLYQPQSVISSNGMCQPFDSEAEGTVFTNGVGLVLLKRLEDALADGDNIKAVILSSSINNDGSRKVGFTAPSVEGQAQVLADALTLAQVDPDTVTCIEAHGTATKLGDPVEFAAIKMIYGEEKTTSKCFVSSCKGNVGHLGPVAGIAGLVKAVLQLQYGMIVPTRGFRQVNPEIELSGSRFQIATQSAAWTVSGKNPRRLGLSSFGMGGTNAHAILQEAPELPLRTVVNKTRVFRISARSSKGLENYASLLAAAIDVSPELDCRDISYTLDQGRRTFPYRRAIVASSLQEVKAALHKKQDVTAVIDHSRTGLVMMFPGQGVQRLEMLSQLARDIPALNIRLLEVIAAFLEFVSIDLRPYLGMSANSADSKIATQDLTRTEITQPVLFAVGWALGKTLLDAGLKPSAVLGHSLGEITAASIAGILDLENAVRLVAARARALKQAPQGAMLAVVTTLETLRTKISDEIWISAINSSKSIVVAGSLEAITQLETDLAKQKISTHRLPTTRAFHSGLIESVLPEFAQAISDLKFNSAQIPMLSTVTGRILENEAQTPAYWVRQIRQPVLFADAVQTASQIGSTHFIELGPGVVLSNLVLAELKDKKALGLLGNDPAKESHNFFSSLAGLWESGIDVDFAFLHGDISPRRVSLPTAPFERSRYWVNPVLPSQFFSSKSEEPSSSVVSETITLTLSDSAKLEQETSPFIAPRNAVEKIIADLWIELLGVPSISVNATFFELGGNSLMAVQLVSRIRDTFEVELMLRDLLQAQTVSQLAELITKDLMGGQSDDTIMEISS